MKEKIKLEKPQSVLDAAKAQNGLNIALELLVFVAVFAVSIIGEAIIMIPGIIILLFTDSEFWRLCWSGDMQDLMEYNARVVTGDAYVILMLFATAGMILVALLFCKLIQKRKMNTLGFRKKVFLWSTYAVWEWDLYCFRQQYSFVYSQEALLLKAFRPLLQSAHSCSLQWDI